MYSKTLLAVLVKLSAREELSHCRAIDLLFSSEITAHIRIIHINQSDNFDCFRDNPRCLLQNQDGPRIVQSTLPTICRGSRGRTPATFPPTSGALFENGTNPPSIDQRSISLLPRLKRPFWQSLFRLFREQYRITGLLMFLTVLVLPWGGGQLLYSTPLLASSQDM